MKTKFVAAIFVTMFFTSAQAWKPTMHAAIAEAARLDALDGYVDILDLGFTRSKGGSATRRYEVDPELVKALKDYPEYYRAGTMGPDAYPDILTGQMVIHPDAPDNTVGGTNVWLEHIWNESLKLPAGEKRLMVRAFATGYLTHGAGDMFGHTFVNHYAGGDFDVESTNFLRHLVLEGYVAKHAPTLESTKTKIAGIEDWIYSTLVDCRKGTFLADRLYRSESGKVNRSFPYVFSKLRDELQENISYFDRHQDDVRTRALAPLIAYQRDWVSRIDRGLVKFVTLSHDIAQHLVLFDSEGIDEVLKQKILDDKIQLFTNQHLIGMLGAPDFVGLSRQQISELLDDILYSYISEENVIRLKANLMDELFSFTGMSYNEVKDYLKRPEFHFDNVMSAGRRPKNDAGRFLGQATSLAQMNDLMGLAPGKQTFKIEDFNPAYNTLVMSKLILLSPKGVRSLYGDLVPTPKKQLPIPKNLMLGYNRKFDGSVQWKANAEKMLFESAEVFERLFKRQDGDADVQTTTAIPGSYLVTVKVTRVKSKDGVIDVGSAPDFYPEIFIGTEKKVFDAINNDEDVSPNNWRFTQLVVGNSADVKIRIWDEDGNLAGDDDYCDASPNKNKRYIAFKINCKDQKFTTVFSGDLGTRTSTGDGSDKVEVTFEVSVKRA